MVNKRKFLVLSSAVLLSAFSGVAMGSNDWPTKPVTVVIPYPAGGAADVVARILTNELSQELGQAFIAEPKPGANSNIAADTVARSTPDGYRLLISGPWFAINQFMETGRRWETSDFTPVARFAVTDNMMAVPVTSSVKTLADYVSLAKNASEKPLQYASPGAGSTQRMASELFQGAAGIKLETVQYKGAPAILPDLVSDRVSMAVLAAGTMTSLVAAGNLRPLATFGETRGPNTQEVPTMVELGYPDAVALSWFGLHAPAGTPDEIVQKLSRVISQVISKPEVQAKLLASDAQPAYQDSGAFASYLEKEEQRWGRVANSIKGEK